MKEEQFEAAPLRFEPYLKSVVWGGEKICRLKGIDQKEPNIGESWEISVLPGYETRVAEGRHKGLSLPELIDRFEEKVLGKEVMKRFGKDFPLLVKFIDASDNLSVQVHPNDELARKRHNSLGKTEMWYILSTDKGAKIYSGFNRPTNPEEYERKVAEGSFMDLLANHTSVPGDIFFLPAGRVHAIGGGNLLVEIQESSDITYRIYDYNRKGLDGKPRELHTELAKEAIDYNYYTDYKVSAPAPGGKRDQLLSSDYFKIDRIRLEDEADYKIAGDPGSFEILICIEGEATVKYPEGEKRIRKGETLLLPAIMTDYTLRGDSTLLSVTV